MEQESREKENLGDCMFSKMKECSVLAFSWIEVANLKNAQNRDILYMMFMLALRSYPGHQLYCVWSRSQ